MKKSSKKNSKKIMVWLISSTVPVFFVTVILGFWTNTALELNTIEVSSSRLPESFNGFRIAHISDLHNDKMAHKDGKLLKMLKNADPDIIAITGDIVQNFESENTMDFIKEVSKIAPCYYVTGNHEGRLDPHVFASIEEEMTKNGITVLKDETALVVHKGEFISISGINDPWFRKKHLNKGDGATLDTEDIKTLKTPDRFNILLSHRPELFEKYTEADIDLVLSGHAHGGQFRVPFLDGLYAPNQGILPEYDSGLYTKENTNMIVSRGIGNASFPFRLNNRPEVILIELKCE